MSTREPPGDKPPLSEPPSPAPTPADFELAEDALSLLDLDPKATVGPEPHNDGKFVASTRHAGTVPQPIIASELLPVSAGNDRDRRKGVRRRLRAGAGGAAAVVLAALAASHFGLWPLPTPAGGDAAAEEAAGASHIAELLPKAPRTSQPAAPKLVSQIHGPDPVALPAAVITPVTLADVDTLDGASLAAVGPKPGPNEPEALDLWAWAQCRRLLAMGDEAARPALEALLQDGTPLPHSTPLGHGRRRQRAQVRRHRAQALEWEAAATKRMRPLQAAAYGGAALLMAPEGKARRTLELLRPLLSQTPQGQLVLAMGEAQGKHPSRSNAHDHLLALVGQAPQMVDAKMALARSYLHSGDINAAMALLGPLAMEAVPDTWAQASHLMWQAKQMTALGQGFARKVAGLSGAQFARQLAQASPAHQTVLRRLMLRHLVEQGDIVAALAWAMAQAQAQPKGAASAWDALRLAHLAQTEAPPGALATILADRDSPGSTALALASGAWRLGAPSWRQAADPLLAELPKKAAAPKLMAALDKQSSHAPEEAVRVLRSVALERHEPAAVSALARAMVASLRPPSADERLEALGRVTLAPARLDTESLRPDLLEASVRTLEAAQTARRPAQILQAAQMLLWQEPLAVDPVLAIVAWAESASALHRQGGGTPQSDPGLNRLDQLIAQRPQDDAVVQRALTLAQTAAPDRVIGLYQTLLLRHPGDLRLTAELAEAYVRGKDRDAAQKLIDPLIAGHGPEAHDGNVLYAQALILADEDPPKARILLDSAILTGAPQARFFALLAQLNLARNLTDDALEALTRACELAPNDVPLHMQRARLLLGKQHLQQADAIATVLLGAPLTDSQRAQVWLLRADVARESNDVGKTVAALKEALAAQPGDAAVLLRLGRLELQELGTSHDAMVHLRQVAQQEPTNALAHYFLGLALRDQNARAEAKQAFARYLALAPTGDYAVDAKDALDGL